VILFLQRLQYFVKDICKPGVWAPACMFFISLIALSASGIPKEPYIEQAGAFLVRQEYAKATTVLGDIIRKDPGNIHALYLKLAVRQTEILDYESYVIFGSDFIKEADSVLWALKRLLEKKHGKDSIDCLYYLANTLGGKAIMKGKQGDWLGAISDAYASLSFLKSVKSLDPGYDAAYLATGVFNYYLSQKIRWLPLFGDKRQEGIRDIRRATNAPFPYDIAAKNTLCWILIENDQYQQADSISNSVLKRYPDNTVFLRVSACIALWTQQWNRAIDRAKPLVWLSEKRIPINWSDLLTGYWVLTSSYQQLHWQTECISTADKALGLHIPAEYLKINYVQDNLKKIANIRALYPKGTM
jgi:hypothetical protein